MNKLYEMGGADKHAIFHDVEIIGDIKNSGFATIKNRVQTLQQENAAFQMKQENYWSALSDDGIIKPFEKNQLLKEWRGIEQSYAALYAQAEQQHLITTVYFQDYMGAYSELQTYLFTTLKLFDDMGTNTRIINRTVFDSMFSSYYFSEKFTTLALTTGIIGNLGFRVLQSLEDPGEPGEIGLYRGIIYQYTSGIWTPVGLDGYIGIKTELDAASLNQYFLAGTDFIIVDQLVINEEDLVVNDENLLIGRKFKEGYIYIFNGQRWEKIEDTTDWRYVVAMVDLVTITGQLPGVFQTAIENAKAEVLTQVHTPKYLGPLTTPPSQVKEGDFFVYSGSTYGEWYNSCIYRYQLGQWGYLDPNTAEYSDYYMRALDDILGLNNTTNGYFAAIFCRAFFAHNSTLDTLSVQTIFLRQNGAIQSDNTQYVAQTTGTRIDSSGNIDANGNTHIGGYCNIDGNVNIGGNININGSGTIGTGITVTGNIVGSNVYCSKLGFYNIQSGNFVVLQESYSGSHQKKIRLNPCCYSSNFNFNMKAKVTAGGDTGSHPLVNVAIYIKKNGSVSLTNYDYIKSWSDSSKAVPNASYDFEYEFSNISFSSPSDYIEILWVDNIVTGYETFSFEMKVNENNPLIGKFTVIDLL